MCLCLCPCLCLRLSPVCAVGWFECWVTVLPARHHHVLGVCREPRTIGVLDRSHERRVFGVPGWTGGPCGWRRSGAVLDHAAYRCGGGYPRTVGVGQRGPSLSAAVGIGIACVFWGRSRGSRRCCVPSQPGQRIFKTCTQSSLYFWCVHCGRESGTFVKLFASSNTDTHMAHVHAIG
jgi:hypothetical protein